MAAPTASARLRSPGRPYAVASRRARRARPTRTASPSPDWDQSASSVTPATPSRGSPPLARYPARAAESRPPSVGGPGGGKVFADNNGSQRGVQEPRDG